MSAVDSEIFLAHPRSHCQLQCQSRLSPHSRPSTIRHHSHLTAVAVSGCHNSTPPLPFLYPPPQPPFLQPQYWPLTPTSCLVPSDNIYLSLVAHLLERLLLTLAPRVRARVAAVEAEIFPAHPRSKSQPPGHAPPLRPHQPLFTSPLRPQPLLPFQSHPFLFNHL